jgi:Arc/MetJ-type ribon-helix-helix transcriptional regulator
MAIVLSPELEQQIEQIVRSGGFTSAEEFIRRSVENLSARKPVDRGIGAR